MKSKVVEVCPYCGKANYIDWEIENDGYQAICQNCGKYIMLCDECLHGDDNKGRKCDWDEVSGCFRNDHPVELYTFPDDDSNYCKWFIVSKKWLLEMLDSMELFNNKYGASLNLFLNYCVWDETYVIYEMAKAAGKILDEGEDI